MKKGIRGHDVLVKGLTEICSRCRENKIEYLQLVLERSVEGFEQGIFSLEYANQIKSQLGGMKIAVLGSYINPSSPDKENLLFDMNKFKEKIRYASILKPLVVGTETGSYIEGKTDSEEAYQYLLKNIKELALEAEKFGVNIGVEGVHCFVINTPQKMARLISDLDMDNIRVIFDPVNYINFENYKNQDKIINDVFDLFADKIVVLHAKDFDVEDGNLVSKIPGEGILNYNLIFKRLKEHNLDIPIISEEIDDINAIQAFKNLSNI